MPFGKAKVSITIEALLQRMDSYPSLDVVEAFRYTIYLLWILYNNQALVQPLHLRMEQKNLYSDRRAAYVQQAMVVNSSQYEEAQKKPSRPLSSPATASPYRLPISPASFYASPTQSGKEKRTNKDSLETQSFKWRRLVHNADDSHDEIDFLTPTPRPSLHERMRGKITKPDPTIQMLTSSLSISVKLRAVFVSKAYGSTSSGLELVSFQSHLVLLHDMTECAKVAHRDIKGIQLGGSEHALLAIFLSKKGTSARSIALLCGEMHLDSYALVVFVQPDDPGWPTLYERMNSCISAEILNETACIALYNDAIQSNTKPFRIPGTSQSRQAPRKPTPIMIGERREITSPDVPAVEDSSFVRQTRARVRSEQSLKEAKEPKPILRYPASGPFAVTLLQSDLDRLKKGEYLNDTMIEFGLRYLLEQIKQNNPSLVQQIHVFNTFFYHKLTESRDRSKTYEHLRKWTNKVNIFDKMYVVVPINEHLHWYMAIIVNPRAIKNERPFSLANTPIRRSSRTSTEDSTASLVLESSGPQSECCSVNQAPEYEEKFGQYHPAFKEEQTYVMVLDSLGITHGPVKTALRDYLRLEARDKGHVRPDVDLKRLGDPLHVDVRVPDQPNFSDCGVYLLHYFDRFFSDPVRFTEISLATRRNLRTEVPVHDEWRSEEVTSKRTWWATIITDLSKDWVPQDTDDDV